MCLGVPGKVVKWLERTPPFARAEVEFGGVRREVGMDCALEAATGDYVLVHAGVAITRLDADEAAATLTLIEDLEAWRAQPEDTP